MPDETRQVLSDQTVCTPEQCRESCGGTTFGTCAYPTPSDLEVVRLRAENEALKAELNRVNALARDRDDCLFAVGKVIKRYKGDTGRAKLSLVIQQAKHLAYVNDDGYRFDEFGRIFGSADEIEKRATQFYLWRKRHPEATA